MLLRRARAAALLAAAILTTLPAPSRAGRARPAAGAFAVIVHEANPVPAMAREQVARLFLKKVARWPDGTQALPVDLAPDSPTRAAFSQQVLGKSTASVRAYWQARIFSGRQVPPPEHARAADAIAVVRAFPGAIAYVPPDAELPPGVRVLVVED